MTRLFYVGALWLLLIAFFACGTQTDVCAETFAVRAQKQAEHHFSGHEYEMAEAFYAKAVEHRLNEPPSDSLVKDLIDPLSYCCLQQGKYAAAEKYARVALKMCVDMHGADDPSVGREYGNLADIYLASKDFAQANVALRARVNILRKHKQFCADLLIKLAEVHLAEKQGILAEQCLDEAIEESEEHLKLKPDAGYAKASLEQALAAQLALYESTGRAQEVRVPRGRLSKPIERREGAQSLPENTNDVPLLTVEQAEALAARDGLLHLNGVATLTDKTAAALVLHKGPLFLNGLTALSDEQARILSRHVGALSLDGLETLSEVAIEALAQHKGQLSLGGLTTLSPASAGILAKHEGWMALDGVTALSIEAAEALAQHRGDLYLGGLKTLATKAESLLRANPGIHLPQEAATNAAAEDVPPTKPLSAEQARLLVRRDEHVRVIASTLSEEAAKVLAEHDGDIYLVLEQLSVGVAARLAKHKGEMRIHVTRIVSEATTAAFEGHQGRVFIATPFAKHMFNKDEMDATALVTTIITEGDSETIIVTTDDSETRLAKLSDTERKTKGDSPTLPAEKQEAASPPTSDAKAAIGAAQPRPVAAPATTQTAAVNKLTRFETECDEICSEMLAAYRAVSNSPRDIVVSAGEKLEELGRNPEKQMNGRGISAGCARATMTYLGMCSFISLEAAARCGGQELPDGGMVGMMDSMLSETDERLRGEGNAEEYWTHMALVRASIKLYANSNAFNSDFERQLIEGGAQPVVIHEMQRLRRDVLSLLKARYAAGIKYALGQYGAPPFSER
jgi:hypothetical protein